MWKRILCAFACAILTAALLCPSLTSYADTALRRGDTVQYIFTIGEAENIAGIVASVSYDPEYLTLSGDPEFLIGGQGISNTTIDGEIHWSTMINGGRAFSNEDVYTASFTVNTPCSVESAALSFNCEEIFSHDLVKLPLTLLTARVNILATGTDEPEDSAVDSEASSDTDTAADTDKSASSDVDSEKPAESSRHDDTYSVRSVIITSTDLTPEEDDTVIVDDKTETSRSTRSTRSTVSRSTSSSTTSAASSSEKASSVKTETQTTPQTQSQPKYYGSDDDSPSKAVSSKVSVKASSAAASISSKNTGSTSTSTVQTAGRIVIAALAAIFAAAGATVLLAKKLKTGDE